MSSPQPSRSPIVEFLGEDAGAGGPFALLGLLHEISSDDQIYRACNRRMHQIDRHRHRSTPDAGEVRLAIHAAASQLLDPVLRAQLALRWPAGIPVSVPKAWKPALKAPRVTPVFLRKAKLLIAASGGWNAVARKRLAHLARVNRVTALELVAALSPSTQSEPIKPIKSSRRNAPKFDERVYLIDPPPTRSFHWIAAYGLMFLMAGAVVTTIVVSPTNPRNQITLARETPGGLSTGVDGATTQADRQSGEVREDLTHYTAIAHELDQLARRVKSDMSPSIERFAQVYPQFVEDWAAFPEPALKRSVLHIAEFGVLVSESGDLFDSALPIFSCDLYENNPTKSMIQAAVIDVVLSSPGLSTKARSEFEALRKRCFGTDSRPTSNIITALVTVSGLAAVDSRTDDPQWWSQWIKGVRAATSQDESQRIRLILSAMSSRLRDQTPPGEAWKKSVIELVRTVQWREGSPERYWLLSQFADQAVSTPRLAALTEAIATHSGAQQVTAQMVLNPSSTFLQRQQLAEIYRSAWTDSTALSTSKNSANIGQYAEIINEMHLRVSITPTQMDDRRAIEAIIELARLNTAAWQYAHGDDELAGESLLRASDPIGNPPEPELLVLTTNRRDIRWAELALNSKDANELSALFAELVSDGGPGMNSAHALVFLATLHADSQIREGAKSQIVRYKDRPSVLLAIDHVLGNKRISTRLDRLVVTIAEVSLPSRTDESWYLQAHNALLAKGAKSISKSIESDLSILEHELGLAYGNRVAQTKSLKTASGNATTLVRGLYQRMVLDGGVSGEWSYVDPNDFTMIESATDVRLARATSPLHQFLSYQRAVCELLAVYTDRDLPGSALRVRDLISDLKTRLDQSDTVIEQIAQVERCIAQLWIERLEGGNP